MTKRSILITAVCAIVLASCLAIVPSGSDDASAEAGTGSALDSLLEKMAKGGVEAGASLELTDEKAMEALAILCKALPEDIVGESAVTRYLSDAESPTLEGLMLEMTRLDDYKADASGALYVRIVSAAVKGGVDYTLRAHGDLALKTSVTLDKKDPDRPDTPLTDSANVSAEVDAVAVLHVSSEGVPQSMTAKAVAGYSAETVRNYEMTWSNGECIYTVLDSPVTENYRTSLTAEAYAAFVGGLTEAELEEILDSESMDKEFVVSTALIEEMGGKTYIKGTESRQKADLSEAVPEGGSSEGSSTDASGIENAEDLYFAIQEALEKRGMFLSEQAYRTAIGTLKNVKDKLMDGSLSFYYSVGDNSYNMDAKESIASKVDGSITADLVPIVTGYDRTYNLDYRKGFDRKVMNYRSDLGDNLPSEIMGYLLASDNIDESADVWVDGDDVYEVTVDSPRNECWRIAVVGDIPESVTAAVKDDPSLDSLVKLNDAKESILYNDVWMIDISADDAFKLKGKQIVVSWAYGGFTLEVSMYCEIVESDGVLYSHSGSNRSARAILDGIVGDEITVSPEAQFGDTTFPVDSATIKNTKIGTLILKSRTWIYNNDGYGDSSEIKGIRFANERAISVDLDNLNTVPGLEDISFEGPVNYAMGTIDRIEGWTGPGYRFTQNGLTYTVCYYAGKLQTGVTEIENGMKSVQIPAKVTVGDKTYPVGYVSLANAELDSIAISSSGSVALFDSTIGTLTIADGDDMLNLHLYSSTVEAVTTGMPLDVNARSESRINLLTFKQNDNGSVYIITDQFNDKIVSVSIEGEVPEIVGDVEPLKRYFSSATIGGLQYLLVPGTDDGLAVFMGKADEKNLSVTVYGTLFYENKEYRVSKIDLSEIRTVKDVTIESVPENGMSFYRSSVASLTFANTESVDISEYAFAECDSLRSVIFNGPVGTISTWAFWDSTEIKTLGFNSSVGTIEHDAFAALSGVTSLVFDGDVGCVEYQAFGSFSNLLSVGFEGSLGDLEPDAFADCGSLTTMKFNDVGTLCGSAGCASLTTIILRGDVQKIPSMAFDQGPRNGNGTMVELNLILEASGNGETPTIYEIDSGAFRNVLMSEEIISSLLGHSVFVSPQAFDLVYVLTEAGGSERYAGTCSAIGYEYVTGPTDSITFEVTRYVENGKVSLDLIGVISASYGTPLPDSLTIPDALTIDETEYPVTALMYEISRRNEGVGSLTVGSNVKRIMGSFLSYGFPDLTSITINKNDRFSTSTDQGLTFLYEHSGGTKEIITVIGTSESDSLTIPGGITEFDLNWIMGSKFKELIFGDDVEVIAGSWLGLENLEKVTLGKSVSDISTYFGPGIQFTVSADNTAFAMNDGALFLLKTKNGNATATLFHGPAAEAKEYCIPSEITVSETKYRVTDMDDKAFWYSNIKKVVVPDTVSNVSLSAFYRSATEEVVLPNDIECLNGPGFWTSENLKNVHSLDGERTYTSHDGAVYFLSRSGENTTKDIVCYIGTGEILFVESGTGSVNLDADENCSLEILVLPQECEILNGFSGLSVLAPKDLYCYSRSGITIREYSVSDHYDITFTQTETGLKIGVASDHASISAITLGEEYIENGELTWAQLFPKHEESSELLVYNDAIEISVVIEQLTVSFVTGSIDSIDPVKVEYGQYLDWPKDPLNGTMLFTGWFTDENRTESYDFDEPVTTGLTLYAGWAETCTVSFVTGTSTVLDPVRAIKGSTISDLRYDLQNNGLNFGGWYTDPGFTEGVRWYTVIDSDMTLYAKWTGIAYLDLCEGIDYIVIDSYYAGTECYLTIGEHRITNIQLSQGYTGTPVVKVNGVKVGETFTVKDAEITISVSGIEKMKVSVDYINNLSRGTCGTASATVLYGEPVRHPAVTAAEEYRFVGWATASGMIVEDGASVYGDAVLTAAYVREKTTPYTAEHTIELSIPANASMSSAKMFNADEGSTISLPTVSPAKGYKFNGWLLDGENIGTSLTVSGNAVLTADISKSGSVAPSPTPVDPTPVDPTPVDPEPTPVDPDPAPSEKEETVNKDGSITIVEKNEDGTSMSTTTKENEDGSVVVKKEELDKDGKPTGNITTTTKTENGTTEVKETKTENGSVIRQEDFDADGNSKGSTTKVTETAVSGSGSTIQTETVTAADGEGNTLAERKTVTTESANGKTRTEATVQTKADGTTESSATTTVKAEMSGGKIEVSNEDISKALEQMDEVVGASGDVQTKTIEIGTDVSSDSTEVSISAESMKQISESGADVKISSDVGSITLSTPVSESLASRGETSNASLSLSISKAGKVSMTQKQQEAVGESQVLRLEAFIGNESVHDLGGEVTVTVPYVLSPGENPDLIKVYYVDDEGDLHMKLSKYDAATHTVSFVTDHFSYYMISMGMEDAPDSDNGFPAGIAAVIAAIAVIAVAAVVVKKTR